ncbi:MAG: NAD(+)/NADH kinase [Bacteroidota bacterium]|nr:NAD(+)/NADH kinase [Bacteroidota bacterium]
MVKQRSQEVGLSLVGIIANPASGKDIRRLVAYGSVFDNQEKVRIVRRVLLGLAAAGVERICYMPDYFGIVERALARVEINIPVFPTSFPLKGNQEDSIQAARTMEEQGTACIITLGGDGTNRAVAKGNGSVPILPISTGTNNVFPFMVEGTIAGLAAGLVAGKLIPVEESTFLSTQLEVVLDGKVVDLALVDAVVYNDVFMASRAVWNMDKVRQIFLNRAKPDSIGLSSIGGLIHPIEAEEPQCLYLEIGRKGQPVTAPVAPGIIEKVFISNEKVMKMGEEVKIGSTPSVLALDGEREVEVRKGQYAAVRLGKDGPVVVDVGMTMSAAMKKRILAPGYIHRQPEENEV